jgi:hypothetical protein
VKVGDVIEHGGMKYKVAGLEYVWVAAHPMKKDGSWSKVTKNLYSFKGGA